MFVRKLIPLVSLRAGILKSGYSFHRADVGIRSLGTTQIKFSMDERFTSAQKAVTGLQDEPDNTTKLRLYSLFKQGSQGKCKAPKPGALEFVKKAKWDAWTGLGDMTQDEAKSEYVKLVDELLQEEQGDAAPVASSSSGAEDKYPGLKVTTQNGVRTILLNRPDKKNSITHEMYVAITEILNTSGKDDQVKFAVIRGAGDFFCSGNDLGNFTKGAGGNIQQMAKDAAVLLKNYVGAYIDFPKPLVIVVNGPAIGIAVTTLGLADIVYANQTATFQTPFSSLGQSPEGCSSYIFPKLMGYAQANEVLMLNKRLTATEAAERHLVSQVIPSSSFDADIEAKLKEMAELPPLSLMAAKQLSRSTELDILHKINEAECERLIERWTSEDCIKALTKFFQRKAKM